MFNWYKKVVFENYANFNGRARRSEYWYFALCNFLITMVLYIPFVISIRSAEYDGMPPTIAYVFLALILIYSIATLIPSLAVSIRRLHDIGKSGWNYLISIIPFVGPIILLIWMLTDSESGENKWGPNPKNMYHELNEIGNSN